MLAAALDDKPAGRHGGACLVDGVTGFRDVPEAPAHHVSLVEFCYPPTELRLT
jgi:hypothetical protein